MKQGLADSNALYNVIKLCKKKKKKQYSFDSPTKADVSHLYWHYTTFQKQIDTPAGISFCTMAISINLYSVLIALPWNVCNRHPIYSTNHMSIYIYI